MKGNVLLVVGIWMIFVGLATRAPAWAADESAVPAETVVVAALDGVAVAAPPAEAAPVEAEAARIAAAVRAEEEARAVAALRAEAEAARIVAVAQAEAEAAQAAEAARTAEAARVAKADAAMAAGAAARERGDNGAAVEHYRAAVAAAPASYEAKFQLARTLATAAETREDAIRIYTGLLAASPNNSDVLLARGRTYTWMDRTAEAEADLLAVTARSPEYGDAWSALGDLYLWSDRPDSAAWAYGQWIAAKPAEPGAYLARAKAYRAAGDRGAAAANLEAARSVGADPAEVNRILASLDRRSEPEAVVSDAYLWSARLGYGFSSFTPDRDNWHEYSASIRRKLAFGSLAFEYLAANRFSKSDNAIALDGYVDLWSRAYANLRFQYSPDATLYPDYAYRAEIWQGVGQGWELSASYDHMDFGSTSNVDMFGAGLGKYIGNWYLRWRTLFIPATARMSVSNRALARYYYSGTADDYLELNGGFSNGGEFVRNSTVVEATRSWSIGAAAQKYFTPQWGAKLAIGYSDDRDAYAERSASGSLLYRW